MSDELLPTEFDLIVAGTGLTESILAAAASRVGKTVLHLDSNDYYGGSWASFNLESIQLLENTPNDSSRSFDVNNGIVSINTESIPVVRNVQCEWRIPANKLEIGNKTDDEKIDEQSEDAADEPENAWTKEKLMQDFRKFNIDLTPKLLFARGDLVELLISSNISRYAEFRAVDRIITRVNNEIKVVPCSRADVFTSKNVTVVEKRLLMKILSHCIGAEDDSDEYKDFTEKTFREYLEHKRLTPNLIHYILYSIGMSDDETLCLDGVSRVKKFLQSLGRYGNTPFLHPMYGCGEIPQCFCRLSAVFGGIYCLKKPIPEIHFTESLDEFRAIKCNEQIIRAKCMVSNGAGLNRLSEICPQIVDGVEDSTDDELSSRMTRKCGKLARSIYIVSKPICEESGVLGGGVEFLKLPKLDDTEVSTNNLNSGAFVVQLSHFSGTCPKDLYLIHVTCQAHSNRPKADIQPYERLLFGENAMQNAILWSMYFNIPSCMKCSYSAKLPTNLHIACGPFFELDYDESIQQAKNLFHEIYPDDEFLPRAPDPEEIIIEGDNPTEPSQSIIAEFADQETTEATQPTEDTSATETTTETENEDDKSGTTTH